MLFSIRLQKSHNNFIIIKGCITGFITILLSTYISMAGIFTKHEERSLLYIVIIWILFFIITKPSKR